MSRNARNDEPRTGAASGNGHARGGITRRQFVESSALVGGCSALLSRVASAQDLLARDAAGELSEAEAARLADSASIIYSVCLQCHTACPIKTRVYGGVLGKIEGSAYSPQNMLVHLDYETPLAAAALADAKLCPKGHAGIQSLYDPYRIRRVLKRTGRRGENLWRTISFDRAIREIVRGGRLFAEVPGEEDREVPGLAEHFVMTGPDVADALASDAAAVASGELALAEFKSKHADHLDLLIDPDHPDLGPKNNRFVFLAGRIEHGRKEFSQRWLRDGFGSRNWFEHTSICEQSHHIAYQQMTHQWRDGSWGGGRTHMKPDALRSEFVLYFGTSPFEANFGPPIMAEKITEGITSGRLKIAVVDPRLSKTAAKAWKWLPIEPGTDAALALGITRWIIENERYDERFLRAANKAAANAANETSWTDATWLVEIADDGPAGFLRADQAGIGSSNQLVAVASGNPVAINPNDGDQPVTGDLMYEGRVGGRRVKTAFRLLWEEAASNSLQQWSDICGIPVLDIVAVAAELTSHGKRAAVESYRGPVQHTNGYNTAQALHGLNLLVGNIDWAGGLMKGGGHWDEFGARRPGPFDVKKMHPGRIRNFGVKLTREGSSYDKSSLFTDYPAQRPWYPFTGNVYQEVLPAAAARYPYPIGAVFLHMGTPGLATPAGNPQIAAMQDLDAVPLFFADDIVIGESSMYADYIFPDISVWERWATPHVTPDCLTVVSKVRQPIVAPIPETATVFGERMPISMEAVMLAIAEELELPGYGTNGLAEGQDFTRPEDYYLRLAANLAAGNKEGEEVPAADAQELELFRTARSHLPPEVFDAAAWERIVGSEWWPHVVHLLNRGGRYENFDGAYKGDKVAHQHKGLFRFYVETVALARDSMTGARFPGIAKHLGVVDAMGRTVSDPEFPLVAITYKEILGGHSRTMPLNYWMGWIEPENVVWLNRATAREMGFRDGQTVRMVSASNPDGQWILGNGRTKAVEGKLKLTNGLHPGTVAVSWHYGHWAYGAEDVQIDGAVIAGDPRRATGLCSNVILRVDPYLGDVCLTDPIGGSSSFYDTRVRLETV